MLHKNWALIFAFILLPLVGNAATESDPDFFQSTGKIYVVVAVIATVFVGLAIYLYRMDKRITEIEKSRENES